MPQENHTRNLKNLNLKIYVMTHKKFAMPSVSILTPLHVGRANSPDLGYPGDDSGENISDLNQYFGELTGMFWAWKNDVTSDYIGLCHYRRYFLNEDGTFMEEKDFSRIFEQYEAITSKTAVCDHSYYESFCQSHNAKDLDAVKNAIAALCPEYLPDYEKAMAGKTHYWGNLFVASAPVFKDYCQWLFTILLEASEEIHPDNYDLYHRRVYGFLSEQLLMVYLRHNRIRTYEARVGITADKAESHELKLAMQELIKEGNIHEACELFRKYTQVRPDVMLELSDLNGDLRYIRTLLFLMEYEETHHVTPGLKQYSSDVKALLGHVRSLGQILTSPPTAEEYRKISRQLQKLYRQ